ncbi:unnamed protein product [Lathyrus oleraceus]
MQNGKKNAGMRKCRMKSLLQNGDGESRLDCWFVSKSNGNVNDLQLQVVEVSCTAVSLPAFTSFLAALHVLSTSASDRPLIPSEFFFIFHISVFNQLQ